MMLELSPNDIASVSGAVSQGQVLNDGAAASAVGAAVLFAVGSPLLIAGASASAFAMASAGMWLGGAALDPGCKPKRERSDNGDSTG
jgi:hypothetical protein